jgi:hypothetical protein
VAKFFDIAAFFDLFHNTLEKTPEILEKVPESVAAAGLAAALAPVALPLAIAGPAIVEAAKRRRENRPDPGALADIFREALLSAVEEVIAAAPERFTEDDHAVLELWREGLKASPGREPVWARMLEEDIPQETARLISVNIGGTAPNWPALRALLERWSDWFRYRRTSTALSIAPPPRQPLVLSLYAEQSLAINLTAALARNWRREITAGENETAFRQSVHQAFATLGAQLAPLDPLTPITEFPALSDAEIEVQLLNARYRTIPYIGRADTLETLFKWLHGPGPISFLAVTGRGGAGKTRLAYRFLELLEEREPYRWHAGVLNLSIHREALSRERFAKWRSRRPTLMVVDYAAAHAEELTSGIAQLYESTLRKDPGAAPLRFLLLERTADPKQGWYKSVLAAARDRENAFFPAPVLQLGGLDAGDRVALLSAGLQAAHEFERRSAPNARPRLVLMDPPSILERIEKRKMEDPLMLFMAALVAHARQNLGPLDLDRMELAKEVAKHERRRVELLAGARLSRLPLHLAACVTLMGSLTENELVALVREEKAALEETQWQIHELIGMAQRALPPARSEFAVSPIEPDVVGESFVKDVLGETGHGAKETVLRAAAKKQGPVTRSLVRMVQDFAPATDTAPLESEDQKWALDLLTHLLRTRAETVTDAEFWEVHAALPIETIAMRRTAGDFYRIVADARRNGGAADPILAAALTTYALHVGAMGLRGEALESVGRAVEIYRKLAAGNPDAFLADLAGSLNNLATLQSDMGQRTAALESIVQAVEIGRKLAAGNPDAFLAGC